MASHWVEKDRLLLLKTPLGDDKLLLRSFSGVESISSLFCFELDLLSEDPAIDFDKVIGKTFQFGVKLWEPGKERLFHGFVNRFVQLPSEERLTHYRAEIVPWLWFLTRTADCRIFQRMTVPQIVQEVFRGFGFTDFETPLQGTYDPWDYCVQYRETAFQFISRLLEQEGIFYFFRHEKDKHVLVLGDSPGAHKPCPGKGKIQFERTAGPGVNRQEDTVLKWELRQELRHGKEVRTDYNFETPATSLLASVDSMVDQGGNHRFEVFDYPGEYEKRDQGEPWTKLRMEENEAVHTIVSGESRCRNFASGFRFELAGYERRDQNIPYVLTSVTHHAEEGGLYSGAGSATDADYSNRFTAIPYSVHFRPARVTPKPTVHGAQTAVVVGPSGEEIYTDKYGRVKVHFHWDRKGRQDDDASCWIRVSQPWAGKGWGAISIPRIGQEVVVDFLEGDPDRPLITGRVYNAIEQVPYPLPDNQTVSTFKTNSSKGGGGFNELRFEDKKGKEDIFLHAAKDLDIRVENDTRQTVCRDRHLIVQRDQIEEIRRDHHVTIKGKQAVEVQGPHSMTVKGNCVLKTKNLIAQADLSCGISAGVGVVVMAPDICLVGCGGFIRIGPSGVNIVGSMVTINSGGGPAQFPGSESLCPQPPDEAGKGDPGEQDTGAGGGADAKTHDPDKSKDKTDWIEINLVDADGKPVPGERYQVTLPDGSVDEGTLDDKGHVRIDHIDSGTCKVTFPDRDQLAWGPK
jgi:type VI secretion system secreted protein VgrG